MTSYLKFNRHQWSTMNTSFCMTLNKSEIILLKKIDKELTMKEVSEIYLPLSYLLNIFYITNLRLQERKKQPLKNAIRNYIPYIIGITGSVAVGKSTTARILQVLLNSRWPEYRHIELVETDNFLYPNQILQERNLIRKKGFPQSYDMYKLIQFISNIKLGIPSISVPTYSHLVYDIVSSKKNKIFSSPNILILAGLNILQNNNNAYSYYSYHNPCRCFISDFIDFSIYIDASENLLRKWYVDRFLKFREKAFIKPESYFYNYTFLTKEKVINTANFVWKKINYVNLQKNILPTRKLASLILIKSENHAVNQICLRK